MAKYVTAKIQFHGKQWAILEHIETVRGVPHFRRVKTFVDRDDAQREAYLLNNVKYVQDDNSQGDKLD